MAQAHQFLIVELQAELVADETAVTAAEEDLREYLLLLSFHLEPVLAEHGLKLHSFVGHF